MSERISAVKERIRNRSMFQKEDVLVGLGGLLLSQVALQPYGVIWIMPYYAYWYQRSSLQFFISAFAVSLGALMGGAAEVYYQICLAVIVWMLITFLHLIQQNVYTYQPLVAAITALAAGFIRSADVTMLIVLPIMAFVMTRSSTRDVLEVDSSYRLSEMVLGILAVATLFTAGRWIPEPYMAYAVIYVFLVLARILDGARVFVLGVMAYFLLPVEAPMLYWMIGVGMSMIAKQENRVYGVLLFATSLLFVGVSKATLLPFAIISLLYILTPFDLCRGILVKPSPLDMEKEGIEVSKKMLSGQLQQFSSIFTLVKQYYGEEYETEGYFLDGMAKAFQTIAMEIKQNFLQAETLQQKILRMLKAYHYDVVRCKVDEYDRRGIRITLHISNLNKKEAKEVILPMLAGQVGNQVRLVECYRNYLWNGYHHLEYLVPTFFDVEATAWKVAADEACSGDTYSIFRHKNATVCTISDGMGIGEEAKKTSSFVTSLFQKLILSNLSITSSVRCINKLLQAQNRTYATLDVLYFDHRKKEVYLSKSSAAATYLIREGRVYEIAGSSLPIGIIKDVEADCYCMEVKEDDLFLMASDGLEKNIVYKWVNRMMQQPLEDVIREEFDRMKENGVRDDTTVLLARPKATPIE